VSTKKKLILLLLFLLLLGWLWYRGQIDTAAGEDRAAAAHYATDLFGSPAVDDHLLVDFVDSASEAEIKRVANKYRLRLKLNSAFSKAHRLYRSALGRIDRLRLLQELRTEKVVEFAEMEQLYSIPPLEAAATRMPVQVKTPAHAGFPNDPKYRYQWHLDQIGMKDAWPRSRGKGVIVAVIDTGVAYASKGQAFVQVPDLAQTEFVPGYDFVNDRVEAFDDHGHGTHVAGTIAQSTHNGVGVAGVAYEAKIMPLKVLSARGFGSTADIAEAIRFAADNGAKVINMSLGGPRPSKVLAAAVEYAHKRGVLVVCAAGNDGRNWVGYPAAYPYAVGVAATQFDRTTTFYSNWGKAIDLAAPGGNTRVDQNGDGMPDGVLQNTIIIGRPDQNDYLLFMGTSMASPHVAGVAALVIAEGVTEPDAVLKVLKSTAKHPQGQGWDEHYGAGIVDAAGAVNKVKQTWGHYRIGLGAILSLFLLGLLRAGGRLAFGVRPSLILGLLFGATGLYFLPALGLSIQGAGATVLMQGFPAWDSALFGAAGHGNPLFHSALAPLGLALLGFGLRRLRPLIFGFALGVGAHLLFSAFFRSVDISWVPNVFGLDQLWLVINSAIACGTAALVARK
jgi:serine protease